MTSYKSAFFKPNKNVLNNNYMNKETITEEMFQNKVKNKEVLILKVIQII